jgi:adenine-specific DNA-methyltransferase
MASMFTNRRSTVNLLDAGAGVGTLIAAYVDQVCKWKRKPQTITITAYEIEPVLARYLRLTLRKCSSICNDIGIRMEYKVRQEDFLTAAVNALRISETTHANESRFNCAILNPPYRKFPRNSAAWRALQAVGIETTNLYAAFMWLTFNLLESNGELVAITPRSFSNGLYFRKFRTALLRSMSLKRIHLFDSRDKVFQEDNVLQESVILHAIKSRRRAETVITCSVEPQNRDITSYKLDPEQLVYPEDLNAFIHIIPDEDSYLIDHKIRNLRASLEDLNLSVSTGRVVDFRVKHLLRKKPGPSTFPLIYPAHFSYGFVSWPNGNTRKPNALVEKPKTHKLVVPAGYYVLVKRFSAKEEERRVVAAVYDPGRLATGLICFENHINYYHANGHGLTRDLAKGLAAFLNSTLVDQYFRQFNGHTQVNATDLRSLKYPDRSMLLAIGARIGYRFPSQSLIDQIVDRVLSGQSKQPNK